MKSAAERIQETAEDAAKYSQGLLPANVLRTYMHIGADVTLHELSMTLIARHGGKRTVAMSKVIALISEQQRALDAAKPKSSLDAIQAGSTT